MSDTNEGAASGTEAPAGGGSDSLPSAADIMAFDPFGPASDLPADTLTPDGTTTPPPADDKGTQGSKAPAATPPLKAGEQPPAGTPPKVPTPPAGDQPAPQPAPVTTPPAQTQQDLAALIAQQTATITAALQPKDAAADAPPPPKYQLGIPPQVLAGLRSEDQGEFAASMHAVINGIANRLWQDVDSHLQQYVTQQVPRMISSHSESQTTQQQVAADFYGAHKSLANPILKPMIQNVGLMVIQKRQAEGKPIEWSPEVRDEIAEAVYQALPQLRPAGQQQQQAAPPAGGVQPPAKPPFSTGNGSRPAPQSATNEFTELLQ